MKNSIGRLFHYRSSTSSSQVSQPRAPSAPPAGAGGARSRRADGAGLLSFLRPRSTARGAESPPSPSWSPASPDAQLHREQDIQAAVAHMTTHAAPRRVRMTLAEALQRTAEEEAAAARRQDSGSASFDIDAIDDADIEAVIDSLRVSGTAVTPGHGATSAAMEQTPRSGTFAPGRDVTAEAANAAAARKAAAGRSYFDYAPHEDRLTHRERKTIHSLTKSTARKVGPAGVPGERSPSIADYRRGALPPHRESPIPSLETVPEESSSASTAAPAPPNSSSSSSRTFYDARSASLSENEEEAADTPATNEAATSAATALRDSPMLRRWIDELPPPPYVSEARRRP
ncbi:hypothetical protein QRO11_08715 [Paracidovorax citrulli]|uniref:hypothetical protein n=1 Tax=Paracidovorax citrulli TaxID=80869 RepID=UPI0008845787|nr:hypothetical protein [Paracidovorax citrulli]UMT88871.1 hypothetical protein FRC90_12905 [Paracidovorax citrulli]WIY36392.1 hypothetical protein QRO11_08715 [Paracidovorax citrulli]SDL51437.1 hypothetical protein SAMN04489709_1499 [Paracidovorax citrulli]